MDRIEKDSNRLVATVQGVLISIAVIAGTLTVAAQIVHWWGG